jgi:hypothetical protein
MPAYDLARQHVARMFDPQNYPKFPERTNIFTGLLASAPFVPKMFRLIFPSPPWEWLFGLQNCVSSRQTEEKTPRENRFLVNLGTALRLPLGRAKNRENGDCQVATPTPIVGLFTIEIIILGGIGADQPEYLRARLARLARTDGDPARMQKTVLKQNSNEELLTQP